jgi:hypothetical protein
MTRQAAFRTHGRDCRRPFFPRRGRVAYAAGQAVSVLSIRGVPESHLEAVVPLAPTVTAGYGDRLEHALRLLCWSPVVTAYLRFVRYVRFPH